MDYKELLKRAKENQKTCRVCVECNGKACKGEIPGVGGKGSASGFIRNYEKLKNIKIHMDTLYNFEEIDTSIEIFGKKFKYPIFAAPIGGINMAYAGSYSEYEYQEAIIKGCKNAGIVGFTGDGADDNYYYKPLEVIGNNSGWGIPTVKPWKKDEILRKIRAAEDKGVIAIAMDVDAAGLHMLAKLGKPVEPKSSASLKEIISSTKLPFIIKGIMTVEGAIKAYEAGANAIVVSNHGGRVLDDTLSTIEVLPSIIEAVKDKLKILVDGGFRTGLDVFKGLALGADGVLIGRPYGIAVHGGGIEGVEIMTNKIGQELYDTMMMTGCKNIKSIKKEMVTIL